MRAFPTVDERSKILALSSSPVRRGTSSIEGPYPRAKPGDMLVFKGRTSTMGLPSSWPAFNMRRHAARLIPPR
ncbi:hypothetical protein AGR13a_Cc210070 [Agrobacterium genomosp. 13 str. CFBP 6927]|uniref:Uncharacterized protein n=1 Tax=Agrobacterium genomosp. 13 str. CFBP 6927 TaxID=1183428 RepID=A0ABP2BH34_9HYPH|nr:hypothetical protein AGR13a_Cc210070 [Agrobacterium genomosp. 13 str. CFBP 6927]